MVDLAGVFGQLEAVLGTLIDTSGTTVDFRRDPAAPLGGNVDPNLLELDPATLTDVALAVPAIVVIGGAGAELGLPEGPPMAPGDARIVTRPQLVDVAAGDLAIVAACRDAAEVGKAYLVHDMPGGSHGAVRQIIGSPVRLRAHPGL